MKTLTFNLALLLSQNSYCYLNKLNPVMLIYDSKVYQHQTKVFSIFRINADTGQFVLVFNSFPKNINPFSIEFENTNSISINEIHSILKRVSRIDIRKVYIELMKNY